jgi:hypothetical protein
VSWGVADCVWSHAAATTTGKGASNNDHVQHARFPKSEIDDDRSRFAVICVVTVFAVVLRAVRGQTIGNYQTEFGGADGSL